MSFLGRDYPVSLGWYRGKRGKRPRQTNCLGVANGMRGWGKRKVWVKQTG